MDFTIDKREYDDGRYGRFGQKDGRNHGPWQTFHPNGKPHIDRHFEYGAEHGVSRTWDVNGNLLDEKHYQFGALHGAWRIWNPEGELTQDAQFEYGFPVDTVPQELIGRLEKRLAEIRRITPLQAEERHDELVCLLAEKSAIAEFIDAGEPSRDPDNWLGLITHLGSNEEWPQADDCDMVPLLQIRVDHLPDRPQSISKFELICIWGPHEFPLADGVDELVIRTYSNLQDLQPVQVPEGCLRRKPVQLSWREQTEYPDENDLPPGLDFYFRSSGATSPILNSAATIATKVGGWPAWLQFTRLYGQGDYVVLIDSCDFPEWDAGDGTVFHCFVNQKNGEWWSFCEMC